LVPLFVITLLANAGNALQFSESPRKNRKLSILKAQVHTNQPITATFKDTELKDIMKFFSAEYGLNIVVPPPSGWKGKFQFSKSTPSGSI